MARSLFIRSVLIGLCVLPCVLFAAPAQAQRVIFLEMTGPLTSDPAHIGYVFDQYDLPYPVVWKDEEPGCGPCGNLAGAYNKTMHALMNTRYWIAEADMKAAALDEYSRQSRRRHDPVQEDPGGPQRKDDELSYRLGLEEMRAQLPALKEQEESLELLGDDLRAQLPQCRALLCVSSAGEEPVFTVSPDAAKKPLPPALPFEWQGPYPQVCPSCAASAAKLDGFPASARLIAASLEAARAELLFAELEILALQIERIGIGIVVPSGAGPMTDEEREKAQAVFDRRTRRRFAEMLRKKEQAENDIARHESALDLMTGDFTGGLALYNHCVSACALTEIFGPPVPKTL